MSQHFYRPSEGHRLPHDPFNAIVAPRPIGWIGTLGVDGRRNLAPYSFFNAFNYRPPIVGFASIGHKHTVTNLEATGEFTWNLVTRGLAGQMNATSTLSDVDEFELAGLEAEESVEIAAPRVAASPPGPAMTMRRGIRSPPLASRAFSATCMCCLLVAA